MPHVPLSSPCTFSCGLPSVCQSCSLLVFSSALLPLITSPGLLPPHLLLVCSSMSVYLVSVFPSLLVKSLCSVGLCLRLPWSMFLSMFFQSPYGMCFLDLEFLHFAFVWFLLNLFLHAFLYCFLCYFGFWSLDLFCFLPLGFFVEFSFCKIKARLMFPQSCLPFHE